MQKSDFRYDNRKSPKINHLNTKFNIWIHELSPAHTEGVLRNNLQFYAVSREGAYGINYAKYRSGQRDPQCDGNHEIHVFRFLHAIHFVGGSRRRDAPLRARSLGYKEVFKGPPVHCVQAYVGSREPRVVAVGAIAWSTKEPLTLPKPIPRDPG